MSMMLSRRVTSLAILAAIFSTASTFSDGKKKDDCNQNSQNVGTVLFHGGDMHRKCWEDCSYLLLQARWIAQTLIPRGKVNISNEAYIDAFISYVESTLQITRGLAKGLAQQMMVDVLADVHGGYLRATLLPLTREAFYAGTVRYDEANKLFELYEELKTLLSTDGTGWQHTLPSNLREHLSARRLDLASPPKQRCDSACEDFIPYEKCKETKSKIDTSRTTTRKPCVSPCNELTHIKNKTCPAMAKCCASTSVVIPIPFLDDNHHPHSIAVPLRPLSLHSLFTAKSQSLVTKYYKSAMRCLLARNTTKQEILEYNRQFRRWLVSAVLPHLNEETFYPAFGSVMRIVETMRGMGFEHVDQELLIPTMNEPPKVNSLRTLLKAARLEGQGSWKAMKPAKLSTRHRNVKTTTTCKSDVVDDEEVSLGKCAPAVDENTEQCSYSPEAQFQSTESGFAPDPHQIQTVYSDFEPQASRTQGKSNVVKGKLPRSTMDVLLCIILGMLGTLLLWVMCACCYCLITRLRGKPDKKGSCYPKGERSDGKSFYGTTDDRGSYPPVQPVAYEYVYDTRTMRPVEVSDHPHYSASWNQPAYASDLYQQHPPSACRIIMMPPLQEPPPPQEKAVESEPEPPPPPPPSPPPPSPPPPREAPPYYHSPSYHEHEPHDMELDLVDSPQSIRRPPSTRQQPPPKPVHHSTKVDYPAPRSTVGKSLGTIESLQSITSPHDSGQYLVSPKRPGDSDVSIPPSLLGGDDSTQMRRMPTSYASQARQSSMYRGRRKTLPQQVKSPRISNMPLGSW